MKKLAIGIVVLGISLSFCLHFDKKADKYNRFIRNTYKNASLIFRTPWTAKTVFKRKIRSLNEKEKSDIKRYRKECRKAKEFFWLSMIGGIIGLGIIYLGAKDSLNKLKKFKAYKDKIKLAKNGGI